MKYGDFVIDLQTCIKLADRISSIWALIEAKIRQAEVSDFGWGDGMDLDSQEAQIHRIQCSGYTRLPWTQEH